MMMSFVRVCTIDRKTGRTQITLSSEAVIVWPYKLVNGKQQGKGWWSAPVHPNASHDSGDKDTDAGKSSHYCTTVHHESAREH